MTEAIFGVPDDTMEVVSEDDGTMVTLEEIVSLEGVFSKGTAKINYPYSIALSSKKPKNFSVFPTVLLTQNRKEKDCAVCFQDRYWNTKKK